MNLSLRNMRKSSWVPALAAMTSVLLVVGQVFHCCRINEAVSALVSHAFDHLGGRAHEDGVKEHPPLVPHHAACHKAPPEAGHDSHPIQPDEPCLSEADLALKAVQPGTSSTFRLLTATGFAPAPSPRKSPPSRPHPPDAAGLPPYLLTLRLLV